MNTKQTKKDEISEFCHLMIKINIETKGKFRIQEILKLCILPRFEDDNDMSNKDLIYCLEKYYDKTKNN